MNLVIFLDFDGTLFPRRTHMLPNGGADPVLVFLLNKIGEGGAKILTHSTAREQGKRKCLEFMEEAGINVKHVHDDVCTVGDRWTSILDWLSSHPEVTDVFVIDDTRPPDSFFEALQKTPLMFQYMRSDEQSGIGSYQIVDIMCHQAYTQESDN
jgi:hypothetical protein